MLVGAKRIGLLFSGAEIDWDLNPALTRDIPDITIGEELFSDGEHTSPKSQDYSKSFNRVRLNVAEVYATAGEKEKDHTPRREIYAICRSDSVSIVNLMI